MEDYVKVYDRFCLVIDQMYVGEDTHFYILWACFLHEQGGSAAVVFIQDLVFISEQLLRYVVSFGHVCLQQTLM